MPPAAHSLSQGLWYGVGGSFVTGNAMSSELDFNTSAVAVRQVPFRAPLEWYSDVGRKSKSLSERPTRPRVLRGESPRALNCPVRRASISDASVGNDVCSART